MVLMKFALALLKLVILNYNIFAHACANGSLVLVTPRIFLFDIGVR